MYERFTDRARLVLGKANAAAKRLKCSHVDTHHLLIGIIEEGKGIACVVLKNLDFDRCPLQKIREVIDNLLGIEKERNEDFPLYADRLPKSACALSAIRYAIKERKELGHNHVGTEHLLLGLLSEKSGLAAAILEGLGVSAELVREEVLNLLGRPADPVPVDSGVCKFSYHGAKFFVEAQIIALLRSHVEKAKAAGRPEFGALLLQIIKEIEGSSSDGKPGRNAPGPRQADDRV